MIRLMTRVLLVAALLIGGMATPLLADVTADQSAVARTQEPPTLGTNGSNILIGADKAGKQIVLPYANPENFVSGATSVTGTSSTALVAAPGAGLYLYITSVACFDSGATATTVSLQNGSGGTTIWEGYVAAAGTAGNWFTVNFPVPLGGIENMTAATGLYFKAGSSTTSLFCNAQGYVGS